MMANAVIHILADICFLLAIRRHLDAINYCIMSLLVLIATAVPFAVESALLGFQSHFYFLMLFGLAAIWLVSRERILSWRWSLGCGFAGLSYLSMASGALTFLACFLVVLSRIALQIEKGGRAWLGAALLLAGFALALGTTPNIARHFPLRAHSVTDFLAALGHIAGWPLGNNLLLAIVIYLPSSFLPVLFTALDPYPITLSGRSRELDCG